MLRFSALALLGGAAGNYVEYSTYTNDDCANVLSTTLYTGIPCKNLASALCRLDSCSLEVPRSAISGMSSSLGWVEF